MSDMCPRLAYTCIAHATFVFGVLLKFFVLACRISYVSGMSVFVQHMESMLYIAENVL